jgi:hypothetical protein
MFKDGDDVFLTCDGETIPGKIDLISPNQAAAMLSFDGLLGGHAGFMGVARYDDMAEGSYLSIINHTRVTIRPR